MKKLIRVTLCITSMLVLSILPLTAALAQVVSPITINLVADKISYLPGEPIQIRVNVVNSSGQNVITRQGFMNQAFGLKITFTDPDNNLIRTKVQPGGAEPGPPQIVLNQEAVPVEIVPSGGSSNTVMDDAHVYYDLTKLGHYTAQVFVALETFSTVVIDPDTGGNFAFLNDPGRQSFNPVSSNTIAFDIVSPTPISRSSLQVMVNLLQIGTGTQPPVAKIPLEGIPVHLIRRAAVHHDFQPINFKTYALIYENTAPFRVKYTDHTGLAKFDDIPQNDYLIIGHFDGSQDVRYVGSPLDAADPGWGSDQPFQKHLQIIQKADGKKVPGKTTQRTGSLLLITEPEYIEWDSTQELYPFAFESIGDWTVQTSVTPPEGFVADYGSLSAQVMNEAESVQFTITDVGSRWEETEITHRINHMGKTEIIRSKIGVKLSEQLAKKKGLGLYGHTESPGSFKGGRKVDLQNKGGLK